MLVERAAQSSVPFLRRERPSLLFARAPNGWQSVAPRGALFRLLGARINNKYATAGLQPATEAARSPSFKKEFSNTSIASAKNQGTDFAIRFFFVKLFLTMCNAKVKMSP